MQNTTQYGRIAGTVAVKKPEHARLRRMRDCPPVLVRGFLRAEPLGAGRSVLANLDSRPTASAKTHQGEE